MLHNPAIREIRDELEPFVGKPVDKELAKQLSTIALGGSDVVAALQSHLYPVSDMARPADILGPVELSGELGLTRQRIHELRQKDPLFPESVKRLQATQLWLAKHAIVYSLLPRLTLTPTEDFKPERADRLADLSHGRRLLAEGMIITETRATKGSIAVDELVGLVEVAELIGFSEIHTRMITAPNGKNFRTTFPEPVVNLSKTRLWLRSEILAYNEATSRS